MRFIFAATTLIASVSAAALWNRQTPNAPPACSALCFDTNTNNITRGSCSGTDLACLCRDPTYLQAVINCLTSVCDSLDEVQTALQFSTGYCGVAGVNAFPTTLTTGTPGTPTQTPAGGNPPLSVSGSTTSPATTTSATQSQGAASNLKAPAMGVAALVLAAAGLAL